jgi:ADP-heptose:LPS heptosyltransferase
MCLPALKAAREVLPQAELVGLVTETSRSVLAPAACLDRFIATDGAPLRVHPARVRAARALERLLASEEFALAVIFPRRRLRADDHAHRRPSPRVRGRVRLRPAGHGRIFDRGGAHVGPRERLAAWRALGQDPGDGFPAMHVSPAALASVRARIGDVPRPWIVLHPFGRTADQWWPLTAAETAARMLRERFGGSVLLVGGGSGSAPRAPAAPDMIDLGGRLSLDELIALIGTSDCVISTDSGPYHLAGAMDRRGVGLFRASRPEHAGRYAKIASVVAPSLTECHACRWDRCETSPCRQMASLSPEAVVEAAGAALGTA